MAVASSGELVAEGLACQRGDRLVFTGLDFRLSAGSALVLTGRNGSGKSSLLRILATLLRPADGRVLWAGDPVAADLGRYRSAIAYVGHLDAVNPALTAHELLCFWAAVRGVSAPPLDRALEAFGLLEAGDWPCRWLSAGQRRRLALARLIAVPVAIWLLDEPTAALDADGEERFAAAVAEHRATGGSVVVATHQPLALPNALHLALDTFAAHPEAALAKLW